jgi:hypothetical protein
MGQVYRTPKGTLHKMAAHDQTWRTPPVDNALRVLRHLQGCEQCHSVPELCAQLDMAHQVVYPIMRKLVRYGFATTLEAGRVTQYLATQERAG